MKVFICVLLVLGTAFAAPSHNGRIVGGSNAEVGQFPYQISYQYGILNVWQHICGGTIIQPSWILTAAHCVTEAPAFGSYRIVAGITRLDDTEGVIVNVVEKFVHEDYAGGVAPNDIALLQLESPLSFNTLINRIPVPEEPYEEEVVGASVLSGWGYTQNIFPIAPNNLQFVEIPILPNDECQSVLDGLIPSNNPYSLESNICTGPLTGGISACSGDSGGPLVQNNTIVGIVSWGFTPCGSTGAPSVYTKVSNFRQFIESHIALP